MKKRCLFSILVCIMAVNTYAATYEASTETELRDAITTVNSGTGGDTIKITTDIDLTELLPKITKSLFISGNNTTDKPIINASNAPSAGTDTYQEAYVLWFEETAADNKVENLILTGATATCVNNIDDESINAFAYGIYSAGKIITNNVEVYEISASATNNNDIAHANGIGICIWGEGAVNNAIITNTVASGNSGTGSGATPHLSIGVASGIAILYSNAIIANTTVSGNTGTSITDGIMISSGILVQYGYENSVVINNVTSAGNTNGIALIGDASLDIYNSILYDNNIAEGYDLYNLGAGEITGTMNLYNTAYGPAGGYTDNIFFGEGEQACKALTYMVVAQKLLLQGYDRFGNMTDEAKDAAYYRPNSIGFDIENLADSNGVSSILAGAGMTAAQADSAINYDQLAAKRNIDIYGKYTAGSIEYAVSGIDDDALSMPSVYAYPNPGNDMLTISNIDNRIIKNISLFDMSGKLLAAYSNICNSIYSIDISPYPTGMYMLDADGEVVWFMKE